MYEDHIEKKQELEDICEELRMKIRFYLKFLKENDLDVYENDPFVIRLDRTFDKMKIVYQKKK